MPCERYDTELTELALGEAPSAGLTTHLQSCADCRARLEQERRLATAIDHGLREVLAAEPSPQFLGGVRRRVASERALPGRVAVPVWISVAAVLAVTTALGLLHVLPRRPEPAHRAGPVPALPTAGSPAPPVAAAAATPASAATAVPVQAPRTPSRSGSLRRADRQRTRPSRPAEPEVLVAPGQAEALARFVDGLRQRRVEPSSVLATPFDPEAALPEPTEISFRPIELKPLVVSKAILAEHERSPS